MNIFNEYTLKARIVPACITLIPILVLYNFFLQLYINDFVNFVNNFFILASNVSLAIIMIFVFAQFGRSVGKFLFEKIHFKDQLQFPTTDFLLYQNDKLSKEYKEKIRQQIENDFQIKLLDQKEENADIDSARKKIVEAVGLVRNKVKDGRLLLQHNIEYGFYRNVVGGSVIATAISILNMLLFLIYLPNEIALTLSVILFVVYLMPIIFSKKILNTHGHKYAELLFQEYLSNTN
ncbi:MAG: hypothetical protein ACPGO5_02760 [Patescibacteria group bacterium]